jgi:hypothetical protein
MKYKLLTSILILLIFALTALALNQESEPTEETITFSGFKPPLMDGAVFQLGRVIPIRFQLFSSDDMVLNSALIAPPVIEMDFEGTAPGWSNGADAANPSASDNNDQGNLCRTDADNSTWVFLLSTRSFVPGQYKLTIILNPNSDLNLINTSGDIRLEPDPTVHFILRRR